MSLKKLGSETIIYGLSNILGRMLNFILVVPFLTRKMDEEYGVVGDLFFWTGLLIAILVFRMDTAVFRFASREENDAATIFKRTQRFVFGAVGIVLGGMALFAAPLADWLGYPGVTAYVYLVLITVAFDALSAVPLARLRLQQRPWRFVAANLGNVAINLALIFILLHWWSERGTLFGVTYQAEFMVVYYLISIAAASGFRYAFLLLENGWTTRETVAPVVLDDVAIATPVRNAPTLKNMLVYSLPLTLVAVAGIVNALVGPSIIIRFYGEDQATNELLAGNFNAALKLAVFLNLAITAYNYAAEPFFFRQAGSDPAKADKTIYADALRAYGILAALACAAILLFLPWLQNFIGAQHRDALYVLPLLLAANACFGLYSNLSVAYKLTDKTFLGGAIALIGSCIVIGVNVAFIGRIGLYAPAAAMLACYAVMSGLAYLVSRRYFPVDYPVGRLTVYVALAVISVYAGSFFSGADAGAMLGRGAVFALLCAAIAALEWRWMRRTFR